MKSKHVLNYRNVILIYLLTYNIYIYIYIYIFIYILYVIIVYNIISLSPFPPGQPTRLFSELEMKKTKKRQCGGVKLAFAV